MTSPKCIRMTRWLVLLQDLIQEAYWQQDEPEVRDLIHEWKEEKSVLRKSLKGFYQSIFFLIVRCTDVVSCLLNSALSQSSYLLFYHFELLEFYFTAFSFFVPRPPKEMISCITWEGNFLIFDCSTSPPLPPHPSELYNPYFGSIFRAYENPTYFARRLGRFADIYMSSVVNLLDYPIDYSFYVRWD